MSSLAVDIGAESGRVVAGTLVGGRLSIDEVCRFPNTPIRVEGSLRWDIQTLINHVRDGIDSYGLADSVGVDTWGVDYVLLNAGHNLVEHPFHYRDSRTAGGMERLASPALYQETGIQFLPEPGAMVDLSPAFQPLMIKGSAMLSRMRIFGSSAALGSWNTISICPASAWRARRSTCVMSRPSKWMLPDVTGSRPTMA